VKINCFIVDDEAPAVDELRYILSGIPGVAVTGTALCAEDAIKGIFLKKPDMVFLDIKMPGQDGFEVIRACRKTREKPYFVFATAYDQHAVKAFEASVIDYVLKPFIPERIKESVERVRHLIKDRKQESLYNRLERLVTGINPQRKAITKITVEKNGRLLLIAHDEIVYFKAEGRSVLAYTSEKAYSVWGTASLDDLESKLENQGFFRSHRGFLVNLNSVIELFSWFNGKYILTTSDKNRSEIPVSRRRAKELKNRLAI